MAKYTVEVSFTSEQMSAIAKLVNHVKGTFQIEPGELATAIEDASRLWDAMHGANMHYLATHTA